MNKKMEDYKLIASIHTLELSLPEPVEAIPDEIHRCIQASEMRGSRGDGIKIRLNLNRLHGDIFSFSEFMKAFEYVLTACGITQYQLTRVDLRLDNTDETFYKRYAKLHRYLISALALAYAVSNTYRTTDLFSQEQLSVAIKSRYFECENYDKIAESGGKDFSASRLELRSKAWKDNDIPREFLAHWPARWQKAYTYLDEVGSCYNTELIKLYERDLKNKPRRFRKLSDFLIDYQDCIFSNAQMVSLLAALPEVGRDKARERARYHKRQYGIEYFTPKDFRLAIAEIDRATQAFFNS